MSPQLDTYAWAGARDPELSKQDRNIVILYIVRTIISPCTPFRDFATPSLLVLGSGTFLRFGSASIVAPQSHLLLQSQVPNEVQTLASPFFVAVAEAWSAERLCALCEPSMASPGP